MSESLPFFVALLGFAQLFEIVSSLRIPRSPHTRSPDALAHLLIGLFFIFLGVSIYLQDQSFFGAQFPWQTIYIANGLLFLAWLALKLRIVATLRKLAPEDFRADITRGVTYSNVSGDAQSLAAANRPEAMVNALRVLGYRAAWLVKISAEADSGPALSEVNEIFTSPDGRTFAEPETFFARDVIALRSMLSDGAVVETTLMVDPIARRSTLFQRWLARFGWPRKNRPGAGYYFERLEDGSTDQLNARHAARIERIARERGVQIPGHPTFERLVLLARQGLKISAEGTLVDLLVMCLAAPLAIMFMLFLARLLRVVNLPGAWFYLAAAPVTVVLSWAALVGSRYLPRPVIARISGFLSQLGAFFG